MHWARFPAFRHVRHELKKPHLTMKDADRGAVFMRWKEKFLVPDHRVQDISGASFAGESQRKSGRFRAFICTGTRCARYCSSRPINDTK